MEPIERLITGIQWVLKNVDQEQFDMGTYFEYSAKTSCMTSGCLAGWMTVCPALQQEGFSRSGIVFLIHGEPVYTHIEHTFLDFFGITYSEAELLFSASRSGKKSSIRRRFNYFLQSKPASVKAFAAAQPK